MSNENNTLPMASEAGQQLIQQAIQALQMASTGDLSQLTTQAKTSLVAAINEVVGSLSNLSNALTGKADKVQSATNGNFAALDSNGNITDSGHKHSDYLTSHQDISGKADKVSGATNGNLAGLDVNGNLSDSGIAAGNTSIAGIGDGTLTGAVSAENGAINAIVNVYGGKNLVKVASVTQAQGTSLTWILNADGSVTASGTITEGYGYNQGKSQKFTLKAGTYILSGNPMPASANPSTSISLFKSDLSVDYCSLTGVSEKEFTLNTDTEVLFYFTCSGQTSFNVTFYPMLRDARISDSTYVPYAMTNRELTERVIFSGFGIEKTADSNGNFVMEYPVGSDYKSIYIIGLFIVSDGALRSINNANWWYIMYTTGCIFTGLTPNSTYYVKYIAEKVN